MTHAPQFSLRVDERESDYDWFNVDRGSVRIGKLRGLVEGDRLTIYSIRIFPRFQGQGCGTAIVDLFKEHFDVIIADRVRPQARGFWEHKGFVSDGEGNYVFTASPQTRRGEGDSEWRKRPEGQRKTEGERFKFESDRDIVV